MLRRLVGLVPVGLALAPTPASAAPAPPPELTVPAALTTEPQDHSGTTVAFGATASDWKGRALPVSCEPSSPSLFSLGTTEVFCTATDRRERSTTASFPVTVEHLYRPREEAPAASFRKLRFGWYPATQAQLYNLQLWRKSRDGWRKVASVFPTEEDYVLPRSWLSEGERYRLRRGTYRWYVWPWFGDHYGPVLGRNTFLATRPR
jgi:hypothetical protein